MTKRNDNIFVAVAAAAEFVVREGAERVAGRDFGFEFAESDHGMCGGNDIEH